MILQEQVSSNSQKSSEISVVSCARDTCLGEKEWVRLSERGESNLGVTKVEYSVIIGHECISEDPELASDAGISDDGADTAVRACRDGAKVEALGHREVFAAESERNLGDG